MMKKILNYIIFFGLLLFSLPLAAQNTASVSGNWNNCSTWGNPPSILQNDTDTKTINTGITVTQNTEWSTGGVTFNDTGAVTFASAANAVILNTDNGPDQYCCTVVIPTTASITQPSCANGKVGQIIFSTQSNAEYSINNGGSYQASNTFSNLISGTYTLKVRGTLDSSCLTSTINVLLTDPGTCCTVVTPTTASITQPSCANGKVGQIIFSTQSNAEYSVNNGSSYQASNTFSNLSPGTYILKVRGTLDSSCVTSTINVILTNPGTCCTVVTPTTASITQPSCANGKVGQIIFSTQSNAEYSVNNGSSYQASNTFSNLSPGTYTLKIRGTLDSSCLTSTINVTLTDPGACCIAPAITSHPSSGTTNGVNNYTFFVGAAGTGLSYQWLRNGSIISGANGSSYSTNIPASYSVVVSGSCGSATSNIATLTNPCTTGTISTFTASAPYVSNPNGSSSYYVTSHSGVNTNAITWATDKFTFNCAGNYTIEGDVTMNVSNYGPAGTPTSVRINGYGEMTNTPGTKHFSVTRDMVAGESHYFWSYIALQQGMSFTIINGKITKNN